MPSLPAPERAEPEGRARDRGEVDDATRRRLGATLASSWASVSPVSLNVMVGCFVGLDAQGEDRIFIEHQRRCFEAVNAYLRSIGLEEHHEPVDLGRPRGQKRRTSVDAFLRSVKSEIMPLRDHAETLETLTDLRFPHLLTSNVNDALYLPIDFSTVLAPGPSFGIGLRVIGSSYRLLDECRAVARTLGILSDIEFEPVDPTLEVILTQVGASALSLRATVPVVRNDVPGHHWPLGAGGCHKLYEAALFSVEHRAAIVIS